MPMITKGDHVWYRSTPGTEEFGVAIGARVETIENKQYKLFTDDDEVKWVDVQNNTLKLMHASSVDTVEDLISCPEFMLFVIDSIKVASVVHLRYTTAGSNLQLVVR